MVVASTRKRKSVKMTPEEVKALRKYVKTFDTKLDAFEAIGITKPTLDIVLIRGTGAPKTIAKIREALSSQN
jgi:hypothetical protein